MATFELDDTGVMARLDAILMSSSKSTASTKEHAGEQSGFDLMSTGDSTIRPNAIPTPKEQIVLDYLARNPRATQAEAAEALSISRSTVATHMASLVKKGLLRRIGSKKSGRWATGEPR